MADEPPRKPVQAPKLRDAPAARSSGPAPGASRRSIYVIVALTVAAAAILALGVTVFGPSNDPGFEPGVETIGAGLPQNGLVLGDPGAPVTLVEYADIQCPFCARLAAEMPEVVDRYVRDGRVKIELRGLAFIGEDSEEGMRFVYAAGERDRGWDAADLLFQAQGGENTNWVNEDLLRDIARAIGLDPDATLERAESPEIAAQLQEAAASADELEVTSTPSLLIGPSGGELRKIELESLDAEALYPILDEELETAEQ